MQRFEEVKNKVERTRQTLTEAAERARKHEELKSTIDDLKRRKVEEMQRQPLECKNKLKVTADTAEKKGNVVDKVNKILNVRERMMAPVLGIIQVRNRF